MKTGEIADDFQRAKGGFSPFSKLRAISAFLHIPVCLSLLLFICLAISLSASFPPPPFHCHFPLYASGSESLSLFSWLLFSSGTGKLPPSFRLFLFRLPLFLCSLPYSHCHKLYYFRLVFIAFCLTTIRYVYQNACWKNRLQQFPTVGVFCQNCRVGFATFISILVSMISALKLFTCLSILSSLIQTRRTHFYFPSFPRTGCVIMQFVLQRLSPTVSCTCRIAADQQILCRDVDESTARRPRTIRAAAVCRFEV